MSTQAYSSPSKVSSCSHVHRLFVLLLLIVSIILVTVPPAHAKNPINYKSEHSNYGDFHKYAQSAREHLVTQDLSQEPLPKSTEEEDLYYFFSLHDYNEDSHLDGNELMAAFTQAGEMPPVGSRLSRKDLEEMIDHALEEDDTDGDGKISWEEYLASQLYHDAE
ncbi:uncharacterized protein SPPG_00752 [Spizellomyces punctatus DAOM BR117]|uniref:EF-hand domain-containing protein n=1 Tax=Spizellomyces punctatus (strain DAOM BR117) TaxID=645134 RepID=A0A0L0HVI2_SPIPD|nr:uncharacterized protein SPPG_00752 [Spizellomyces punctatus DAOM BR117]KND05077.1 hypothetical protein SPPG_00752 [Spizellomyces punctatus DAOM BR117]|eukprot:XP_016613116.1 hypothetical protein SPPG_00752 [Spizellomyces punctatus DAOM BR117]